MVHAIGKGSCGECVWGVCGGVWGVCRQSVTVKYCGERRKGKDEKEAEVTGSDGATAGSVALSGTE